MDDLITALEIIRPYCTQYGLQYPTHCEHDIMLLNVDHTTLPEEVLKGLEAVGFFVSEEYDSLASFRFGSC